MTYWAEKIYYSVLFMKDFEFIKILAYALARDVPGSQRAHNCPGIVHPHINITTCWQVRHVKASPELLNINATSSAQLQPRTYKIPDVGVSSAHFLPISDSSIIESSLIYRKHFVKLCQPVLCQFSNSNAESWHTRYGRRQGPSNAKWILLPELYGAHTFI